MNLEGLYNDDQYEESYEEGAVIFAEGDSGDMMYLVLHGEVEISVGGEMVETIQSYELFGEMALIDAENRSATATAKSACRVIPINEAQFLSMVDKEPHFSLHVMRITVGRLRRMNSRYMLNKAIYIDPSKNTMKSKWALSRLWNIFQK